MSKTPLLIINRSDSRCGACGRGADAYAKAHDRILSWGDKGPGCGIEWKYVSSDYYSDNLNSMGIKEAIVDMRPDLEWVSGKERYELELKHNPVKIISCPRGKTHKVTHEYNGRWYSVCNTFTNSRLTTGEVTCKNCLRSNRGLL